MSIWSSMRFIDEVSAIRRDKADDYTGEGPETAYVDVATAKPWHQKIRLSLGEESEGESWDQDVLIDVPNAKKLITDLQEAVALLERP